MKYKINYQYDNSAKINGIREQMILKDYAYLLNAIEQNDRDLIIYHEGQLHMFQYMCANLGIEIIEVNN